MRLVTAQCLALTEERPHGRQVRQRCTQGPGLDEDVAERRGLDRPGEQRQPAGVGGKLAQQRIASPTTDHVEDVDIASGELLGLTNGTPVGQGEAVDDATDSLGRVARRRLACAAARPGDSCRHVARR
jgi:hypothetical protein